MSRKLGTHPIIFLFYPSWLFFYSASQALHNITAFKFEAANGTAEYTFAIIKREGVENHRTLQQTAKVAYKYKNRSLYANNSSVPTAANSARKQMHLIVYIHFLTTTAVPSALIASETSDFCMEALCVS